MRPTRLLSALALLLLAAAPGRAVTPSLVKDIEPGFHNGGSLPFVFASLRGGVTLFTASSTASGYELWRSDGTAAGTFQLVDGCPGPCSIDYPLFVETGDRAFFFTSEFASGGVIIGSLWVTGGSPEDTRVLASNLVVSQENPPVWVPELGLLFFTANDGVHGNELWRSDGTAAGTRIVREFSPTPGVESPFPKELTAFRGRLYFVVSHRERGPALWVTDGTARGTRLVRDTWPARIDHAAPSLLRATSTRLFFFAPSPGRGVDLWRSDGSRTGTVPLTDLAPGRRDLTPFGARVIGERLYFVADAGAGQELWISNGNARGTRRLTNLPDPAAFLAGKLQLPVPALGGKAAFVGDDGVHGTELWLTNGTVAGTRGLDLCRGECSSAPVFFPLQSPLHRGKLFLTAEDARGRELWTSDGTAAGTRLVRDLCPGACSSHPGRRGFSAPGSSSPRSGPPEKGPGCSAPTGRGSAPSVSPRPTSRSSSRPRRMSPAASSSPAGTRSTATSPGAPTGPRREPGSSRTCRGPRRPAHPPAISRPWMAGFSSSPASATVIRPESASGRATGARPAPFRGVAISRSTASTSFTSWPPCPVATLSSPVRTATRSWCSGAARRAIRSA